MHNMPSGVEVARSSTSHGAVGLVDLAAVWRRKGYVFLSLAATLLLAALYLTQATPIYEAEARVLVQQRSLSFDPQTRMKEDRNFLATQAEIIRSPLTVRRAIELVPLDQADSPRGTPPADPVVDVLRSLRVQPMVQADVLKFGYRSQDQRQAVGLLEAIIESYREHLREVEGDTYTETLALLTRREKELRNELGESQEAYLALRRESPLIGQGRDTINIRSTLLKDLSVRLNEAKARRIDLENKRQAFMAALRGAPSKEATTRAMLAFSQHAEPASTSTAPSAPGVLPATSAVNLVGYEGTLSVDGHPAVAQLLRRESLAGSRDLATLQRELWSAKSDVQRMSQRYGARHPDRRAAEKQVAWWQKLLNERAQSAADSLTQDMDLAYRTEDRLEGLFRAEQADIKRLDDSLIKEQHLSNNVHRLETAHQLVLTQLSEFELADEALARGRASVTIRVLEGPRVSDSPVWPQRGPFMALAGVVGLVGGLVLVFFMERGSTAAGQECPEGAVEAL